MLLQKVGIKRFRSVEEVELVGCGGFNVLIGKNNSGKSNVLFAINAFFECIRGGRLLALDPPIGRPIDFHAGRLDSPIEITLAFSLSLAERDALMRDIVTEAPQLKTAVDGLDPSLRLHVTVTINTPPPIYAFVSAISLRPAQALGGDQARADHVILAVTDDAATELYARLSTDQQQGNEAHAVRELAKRLQFMWESQREDRPLPPLRYIARELAGTPISDRTTNTLENMVQESDSYKDFSAAAHAFASALEQEAAKLQSEPLGRKIETFSGEESSIPKYVENLLGNLSAMRLVYLRERRKDIGKDEAARLLDLKVSRGGPEILSSIQQTVSGLLGVTIDAFQSDSTSPAGRARAEMDVDDFLVEVNGSGIREALRIVLDVEFEHPDILLIEEPEIHLHPSLETNMMRFLKSIGSECQVFISTHSTSFLDMGDMKNVYLVSKPHTTTIELLDYDKAATEIPRELGIRLSSLFMYDRLVFVEGGSDEDILREFASKLGVNLSQSNVGFIHMGGVRNFTHFAAEATLSFLSKRNVQMWFVIDHDEKDEHEIARLQGLGGEHSQVKVLSRRELENYLISPRAVREFIRLKFQLSGSAQGRELPSEADIEAAIDSCTELLKQTAIDKRVAKALCRPVRPDRKSVLEPSGDSPLSERVSHEIQRCIDELEAVKGRVDTESEEQQRAVDDVWSTAKLDIVPGDLLLDSVCQESGVRFKKERDGARLAALMAEEEIPRELTEIIREWVA